jgi:XTP/dITP diphosphohydrolase
MTTFIIATRNAHKVEEIRGILGSQFQYHTLRDFPNAPAVIEDANTFSGNATKKALELAQWICGQNPAFKTEGETFVLADDSGLEVDALQGAPGVHSARFAALDTKAEGNSPDSANIQKLLQLLKDVPAEKRTARFRCVIALTPLFDPQAASASPVCAANEYELATELFDGACEGRITVAPSGAKGFGYDPLFVPVGYEQSFAELGEDVKNKMSHRARALEKLRERVTKQRR